MRERRQPFSGACGRTQREWPFVRAGPGVAALVPNASPKVWLLQLSVAGWEFARPGRRSAIHSVTPSSDLRSSLDFSFNWHVFAYAFAVSVAAAWWWGLFRRRGVKHGKFAGGAARRRTHIDGRTPTFTERPVAVQVGESLTLLIVAGLLYAACRAFRVPTSLIQIVINVTLDPNEIGYTEAQSRVFYRRYWSARGLAGGESASLASGVPLSESVQAKDLTIRGTRAPQTRGSTRRIQSVSPGYFTPCGSG